MMHLPKALLGHSLLLLSILATSLPAQDRCATDRIFQNYQREFPRLQRQMQAAEADYQRYVAKQATARSSAGARYIIPVVVHIVHRPGDANPGTVSNLSNAKVTQAIEIMNEDFRRVPNTWGDGPGVDTRIEFKLADRDPDGNCHSGINRIGNALSSGLDPDNIALERSLKRLSYWPRHRYLNIWVIHSTDDGTLGWANFPWNTGTPAQDSLDGFVIEYDAFGLHANGETSLGRTATHEVGHWLGLYHTFEGGCTNANCLTDGDRVCDTPPIANSTSLSFSCTATANTCGTDTLSGFTTDQNDMIENYMDYSSDSCMNRFTAGQFVRLQSFLNNQRASNRSDTNRVFTGVKGLKHDFDSVGNAAGMNQRVTALVEWKSRNKLIVAGKFTQAGGIPVTGIATWDGNSWDSLPNAPGFDGYEVTSMAVYKDELYVGGTFTNFAAPGFYLVKFDGATWSKVTTNAGIRSTGGPVRAMQVYKGQLYVGGDFGQVDGNTVDANRVAAWDGTTWTSLGGGNAARNGLHGSVPACYAMTIHDDKLVLGGRFDRSQTPTDTVASDKVIFWDGSVFSSINTDTNVVYSGEVSALSSYAGKLFAGGDFFSVGGNLRQFFSAYNDTTWNAPNSASGAHCFSLEPFNGYMWVGGWITDLTGAQTHGLFTYDLENDTYANVTDQSNGMDGSVWTMLVWKEHLYVGGDFGQLQGINGASNTGFDRIARVKTVCENPPVSIEEDLWAELDGVKVYPNPARDEAWLELPEAWHGQPDANFTVTLHDLMGKQHLEIVLHAQRARMDLHTLSAGTYLYVVKGNNKPIATGRLIRMR